METLWSLFKEAAPIVTITVSTAFAMFKILPAKWLDAKFAKSLEAFKTEQQRQLEDMRFQNNKVFDRLLKLHQREFDVLSEARVLLLETYSKAHDLWRGLSAPNPNGFNDLQAAFAISHNYLFKNSIFLKVDIEQLFLNIDELIHLAICEDRTNKQCANSFSFIPVIVAQTALFSQGTILLDDLKKRIQERIWTQDT